MYLFVILPIICTVYAVSANSSHDTSVVPTPSVSVTPTPQPATREELLTLINAERVKVGVAPFVIDERLNQSAQRKAEDMLKYNYNDHISPVDGKHGYEYINDVGIYCSDDGENLSWITSGTLTAKDAVTWWMNSKPHREAILNNKNTLTGFGVTNTKLVEHFCQQ